MKLSFTGKILWKISRALWFFRVHFFTFFQGHVFYFHGKKKKTSSGDPKMTRNTHTKKMKNVHVKKPEKTLKSARENTKVPVKFFIKFCPWNSNWCTWKKTENYARETTKVPVKNTNIFFQYVGKTCFFHIFSDRLVIV